MMCPDLCHIPALPDNKVSSYYYERALKAWKKHRVPGSNNADAPMRAAALAGEWPEFDIEDPQPGLYRVRLEPRGPFYPCMLFYTVGCLVNGQIANPHDWWPQAAKHPISNEQYTELEAWCHEF